MMGRWNGIEWNDMADGIWDVTLLQWGISLGDGVLAFASFAEFQDQIYFAGDFTSADGRPTSNIAFWNLEESFACAGDVNDDGETNVDDLLAIITQWGPCEDCAADPTPCDGDGEVNVDDLLTVITQWGPCPQ